jgi:hypothetical protein
MADYCSQCTPFERSDINLASIALDLKPGRSESFLCEGCNNRAVYKDGDGNLFLAKAEGKEVNLHPVTIEQLM